MWLFATLQPDFVPSDKNVFGSGYQEHVGRDDSAQQQKEEAGQGGQVEEAGQGREGEEGQDSDAHGGQREDRG